MVDKAVDGVHRRATDVDHMKSHSKAGKRKFPLSAYAVQVLEELHKLNPDGKYICSNKGGKSHLHQQIQRAFEDVLQSCRRSLSEQS